MRINGMIRFIFLKRLFWFLYGESIVDSIRRSREYNYEVSVIIYLKWQFIGLDLDVYGKSVEKKMDFRYIFEIELFGYDGRINLGERDENKK